MGNIKYNHLFRSDCLVGCVWGPAGSSATSVAHNRKTACLFHRPARD